MHCKKFLFTWNISCMKGIQSLFIHCRGVYQFVIYAPQPVVRQKFIFTSLEWNQWLIYNSCNSICNLCTLCMLAVREYLAWLTTHNTHNGDLSDKCPSPFVINTKLTDALKFIVTIGFICYRWHSSMINTAKLFDHHDFFIQFVEKWRLIMTI